MKSIFGPLNFFVFIYVEGGVLGNNYISIKKCTTTFLWVLNFGHVGNLPQQFSKSQYYGDFVLRPKPADLACFRTVSSSASEVSTRSRQTCGLSPRPTRNWNHISLFHFSLHFHSQSKKVLILNAARARLARGRKPFLKEIPFNLTYLHFNQKLNTPSIIQKKTT